MRPQAKPHPKHPHTHIHLHPPMQAPTLGDACAVPDRPTINISSTHLHPTQQTHAHPPLEMPALYWMPSIALTTEMAGVSTPSLITMQADMSVTSSSTSCARGLDSSQSVEQAAAQGGAS